ncbi:aspartate:alanine exchanger family transporter [soil metagenome]
MKPLFDLLAENPLLLLFTIAAIGYPLGRVRVAGVSLGSAAVLFTGLAIGAMDQRLRLPDIVYLLGLAMLVYTIGLASGGSFFRRLTRKDARDTAVGLLPIGCAVIVAWVVGPRLGIPPETVSGMFSGGFTNASGLASTVEAVKMAHGDAAAPVVAYSLAYPVGILGPMVAMAFFRRFFRVDLEAEALTIPSFRRMRQRLEVRTLAVSRPEADGMTVAEVAVREGHDVIFGRVRREGRDEVAQGGWKFRQGDLLTVIGPDDEIRRVAGLLGEESGEALELDRSEFDVRRIFVSDRAMAGRPLRELELPITHGAVVTRLRRGDLDFVPSGSTVLELGDRVRVLARRDDMERVTRLFGDSYKALSDVDLLGLALGMLLGLLLGLVPIPIPGGQFRLGFAGGPLVVALILGKLGRTGPLVWSLPYSANLTLRQFGLMLFSAGIGTRAGYSFYSTLAAGRGLDVFGLGAAMTLGSAVLTFGVGYGLLRIPLNLLYGIYTGAQTQPVGLVFAVDQTKNDLPTAGYARMFPLATVFKIVMGQLLLASAR